MTTSTTALFPARRVLLTAALGASLVVGSALPAQALEVPPRPAEGAVQDQADLLTTQE